MTQTTITRSSCRPRASAPSPRSAAACCPASTSSWATWRLGIASPWRLAASRPRWSRAGPGFRGGETVALRATPLDGRSPADLPPVPLGVLREIGSRVTDSIFGVANVVPDIAATAPDVDGLFAVIDEDEWFEDVATA